MEGWWRALSSTVKPFFLIAITPGKRHERGQLKLSRCNSRGDVAMAASQELLRACPATGATVLLLLFTSLRLILLSFCSLHLLTQLPCARLLLLPAVFHKCPLTPPNQPAPSLHVWRSPQLLSCCPRQPLKLHLGCCGDGEAYYYHRDINVLNIWVLMSWPTQFFNHSDITLMIKNISTYNYLAFSAFII